MDHLRDDGNLRLGGGGYEEGRVQEYFCGDYPRQWGQKRKHPYNTASNEKKYVKKKNTSVKGNDKNVPSTSNAPKNEDFKGKCNYCHKFGHKKTF